MTKSLFIVINSKEDLLKYKKFLLKNKAMKLTLANCIFQSKRSTNTYNFSKGVKNEQ